MPLVYAGWASDFYRNWNEAKSQPHWEKHSKSLSDWVYG